MTTIPLPEHDHSAERASGHWLLARVGKKVLRPGGLETTRHLLNSLQLTGHDVVEFAPGLGGTATTILDKRPRTYVGVDSDEAACRRVGGLLTDPDTQRVLQAPAEDTGLEAESADVVIGEAMLTMQTDRRKLAIMREAARLLRPGGHYAIHEIRLTPDDTPDHVKHDIRTSLARAIKVNARPITVAEWTALADQAGFDVVDVHQAPMGLLKPRQVIADEGLAGTATIVFNVLRQPSIRKRVLTMRATFVKHDEHLGAVGFVLRKRG